MIDVNINIGILILKLDALNVNVMLMEVKIKDVTIIQDNVSVKLVLKELIVIVVNQDIMDFQQRVANVSQLLF